MAFYNGKMTWFMEGCPRYWAIPSFFPLLASIYQRGLCIYIILYTIEIIIIIIRRIMRNNIYMDAFSFAHDIHNILLKSVSFCSMYIHRKSVYVYFSFTKLAWELSFRVCLVVGVWGRRDGWISYHSHDHKLSFGLVVGHFLRVLSSFSKSEETEVLLQSSDSSRVTG